MACTRDYEIRLSHKILCRKIRVDGKTGLLLRTFGGPFYFIGREGRVLKKTIIIMKCSLQLTSLNMRDENTNWQV